MSVRPIRARPFRWQHSTYLAFKRPIPAESSVRESRRHRFRVIPMATHRWYIEPRLIKKMRCGILFNLDLKAAHQPAAKSIRPLRSSKRSSGVVVRRGKSIHCRHRKIRTWIAVQPKAVPVEIGLADMKFPRVRSQNAEAYVTPDEATSCWKSPGPAAGPFQTKLGDGSILTYSWYRFADQPALLNADLTVQEREEMQKKVELLHRTWTTDRDYLPPPTRGELADLDPALLVVPPQGLEVGYVPIATRQQRGSP